MPEHATGATRVRLRYRSPTLILGVPAFLIVLWLRLDMYICVSIWGS